MALTDDARCVDDHTADYSLVKQAVTDEDGFPITRHGVT
jgi:hypothetical protein